MRDGISVQVRVSDNLTAVIDVERHVDGTAEATEIRWRRLTLPQHGMRRCSRARAGLSDGISPRRSKRVGVGNGIARIRRQRRYLAVRLPDYSLEIENARRYTRRIFDAGFRSAGDLTAYVDVVRIIV